MAISILVDRMGNIRCLILSTCRLLPSLPLDGGRDADPPCDEVDRRCDVLQSLDKDIRHSDDRERQPWGVAIAIGVFTAVAYFLGARLGLVLLTELEGVAVFWPASGVAAGILIALGPRARAPVATGVMVAT